MREHTELDHQDMDNRLAAFTDLLLAENAATQEKPEAQDQDAELHELQQTVALLQESLGGGHPEKQIANRIRANLIIQWNQLDMDKSTKPEQNWIETLLRRMGQPLRIPARRRAAYSFVTAIIILLLAIFFLPPEFGSNLVGTAGGEEFPGWLGILFIFVILAIGWWINRSRRQ